MPACGRTCDMGRPECRERERKAAARYTANCLMGHSVLHVRSSAKNNNIGIRVSL